MTNRPGLLFILLILVIGISGVAQDKKTPLKPCSQPQVSQFDFWVGEWDLTWPAEQWGGTAGEFGHGSNSIKKLFENCIIAENFSFPGGQYFGKSWSVYRPGEKSWRQTWVDNKGGYITLHGRFADGKMVLQTPPREQNGKKWLFRMVFKNIQKERFDWDWQRSTDEGKMWMDVWNIHYQRKAEVAH